MVTTSLLEVVVLLPIYGINSFFFSKYHEMFSNVALSMYAAAAKSLQLHPTLCDHIAGSPSGSSVSGIQQARILEWVAISFSMHACTLSHLRHVRLCATLWTAAYQAPRSTGLSRQEYWSGLPYASSNLQ